jgi:glycosyltransferase involved in cell wall biosynthesis
MKISLITVTMGDRPHLLAKLKASLDAQTYRDFEWIVVNHKEHPEFKGGLSKARNFGIAQATGDVVGFPDDDAWYQSDFLEYEICGYRNRCCGWLLWRTFGECRS